MTKSSSNQCHSRRKNPENAINPLLVKRNPHLRAELPSSDGRLRSNLEDRIGKSSRASDVLVTSSQEFDQKDTSPSIPMTPIGELEILNDTITKLGGNAIIYQDGLNSDEISNLILRALNEIAAQLDSVLEEKELPRPSVQGPVSNNNISNILR